MCVLEIYPLLEDTLRKLLAGNKELADIARILGCFSFKSWLFRYNSYAVKSSFLLSIRF